MTRSWVAVVALVGCGRSGFETAIDGGAMSGADGMTADGVYVDPFDAPVGTVVLTFGETPSANVQGVTSDTYLSSEVTQTSYNYGTSPSLSLEGSQKRALLRFDLTAIPAGATIVAARLHLWVSQLESGTPTATIAPILESWTEGTQLGTAGVANYNQRAAAQNWTTAGAGSPGSSGATIASFQIGSTGATGVDLPAATVQGWVDAASTNFGVALAVTGASDVTLSSSDAAATERPELVVTYLP